MQLTENRAELIEILMSAIVQERDLEIEILGDKRPRVVHPIALVRSRRGRLMLKCFQKKGFSRTGRTKGFKEIAIKIIHAAKMKRKGLFRTPIPVGILPPHLAQFSVPFRHRWQEA